jgi:periplasmic protein TonB
MKKSLLKSALFHLALFLIVISISISPDTLKKPNIEKKPIEIAFGIPKPTKKPPSIAKENKEQQKPKEQPKNPQEKPIIAEKTPVQPTKPKDVTPEATPKALEKPKSATPNKPMDSVAPKTPIPNIATPQFANAPARPALPSTPLSKPVAHQAEAAPASFKPQAPNVIAAPKTLQPLATTMVVPMPSSAPQSMSARSRPALPSAPLSKPVTHQAEAAPATFKPQAPNMVATAPKTPQPIVRTAMAAPKVPLTTPPAPTRPSAPPTLVKPTSDETNSAKKGYLAYLQSEINKKKAYPEEAKGEDKRKDIVKVMFRIAQNGTVQKAAIVDPSGSKALDQATLDLLLKKIGKFEPIPVILQKKYMDVTLSIDYTLK